MEGKARGGWFSPFSVPTQTQPQLFSILDLQVGEGRKDAGEEHEASKQDAGIQDKYRVGLGLCLTEFSKHTNLCYGVLIETDGTHVVMARGVAIGEESHTGPSVTSRYTKKMDWCKGERSEGQSRDAHPATTAQPAGRLTPNILFCHTSQAPQTQGCF